MQTLFALEKVMVKTAVLLLIVTAFLVAASVAKAQDQHFAGVQNMNTWFNPALKTNKVPDASVSIRGVNYPNIIAYTSKAATIELPLIGKEKKDEDNIFFMNLTAGISTDNSRDNFMNMSTAMLAFSYALPLNNDNTSLAIGFQGAYTFSRTGFGGSYHFPDHFDQYGALASAMAADPFQSGYNYGYFTMGAGVALFHTAAQKQWYIGGSIRHLNHPYTEWTHSGRLSSNYGIQASYTTAVSSFDAIGGYGNINLQSGVHEQIIGACYTRNLDDSSNNTASLGIGYRIADAILPNAGLKLGYNVFTFYYELHVFGTASANYHRRAFEFSYKRSL